MISTGCLQTLTLYLVFVKSANFSLEWSINKTSFTNPKKQCADVRIINGWQLIKIAPHPKNCNYQSELTWIENVISFHRVVIVENWTLPRILILCSLFTTNNSISSLHSTIWEKIVKLGYMTRSTNQISSSDSGGLDIELTL